MFYGPITTPSGEFDWKRTLKQLAVCAVILWALVQAIAFVGIRASVCYDAKEKAQDEQTHAKRNCYSICLDPTVMHSGDRLVEYCKKECELAHAKVSPWMQCYLAVSEVTHWCGVKSCPEVFGISHVALFSLFFYALWRGTGFLLLRRGRSRDKEGKLS